MDTNPDIDTRTWFITGGTPGGFGIAYAEAALALGDNVALTVRRPEAVRDWAERYRDRVLVHRVDVTEPQQVRDRTAAIGADYPKPA